MYMLISPHCLCILPWFSNSGDTQISVYIHTLSFKKHFGTSSILTRLQCTFAAWLVFSAVAIFLWNSYHLKFTSFCVKFFITVLFRVLKIKINLVKLTFWTAISSHQVMGMSLTKVWVMENIPCWIWSFSCNWLAENKRKWAGHGLILVDKLAFYL